MVAELLFNETSVFTTSFVNLSTYVFGSPIVTSIILLLMVFIVALLIKIPLPVGLALLVPLTIVLMALSWLPILAGGIVIIVLVLLADA